MWCVSGSLALWANAWLAGRAAPDDVLDALSAWAPRHSLAVHDAVSAGRAGLGLPDGQAGGPMAVLATIRRAASAPGAHVGLLAPIPGDVRGLPAGTAFARQALDAGEAVTVSTGDTLIGLVPEASGPPGGGEDPEVRWTVHVLSAPPVSEHPALGAAEYALRDAVRTAADTLGGMIAAAPDTDADPRALVEDLLDDVRAHRLPGHCPARALRVLEQADRVEAIRLVGAELAPSGTQSFSQARITDDTLRELAAGARTARLAAVAAILASARSG
ncbi:hypothetical protein H7J77_14835 [Mycolicibacillus parakoreensis]|uniref:Uncharacterized protein n=1 Tax=Mycolicibacillus parakoreensis TaxID=1069221 RepID=A0ABY3TZS8_9MYCO|nr:hypothetical protein [Mycolicibacillus parakoreensis]MCV7316808.1 hypothetical protein [Mycolicibacillus parakoreensis]ULN51175.1 hypothetical protein MIU77_09430 [Mycolicibacillus parakoreensis]HLR98634.1 hypothetical protein [Mycolicibacillus parakoreensis]